MLSDIFSMTIAVAFGIFFAKILEAGLGILIYVLALNGVI